MKKFLCNLIVPAVMFASLLTLPLWADKVIENPAETRIESGHGQGPADDGDALVARVEKHG